MTYVLIIWLVTYSGAASSDGHIHSETFERQETCRIALDKVRKQSKGRIDGVCVNKHYPE